MKLRKFIGNRNFYHRLFSVMIPVLIQNIITNFVSLLDNVMVGRVGTEPMSGVAIVNQLFFVFNLCIFGGLAGPGIFTAQFYGKGDTEGVRNTFRIKIIFAILASAAAELVFIFFRGPLISGFLHEGNESLDLQATFLFANDYMKIMMLQIPLFALIQTYSSTLREIGETKVPMVASIIAVFINLVFNYILIFGKLGAPVLGVQGAAIATVISRIVECFIIIFWTHSHSSTHGFIKRAYSTLLIPAFLLKDVVVLSFPLFINELLWSSGMTVLNQCYSLRGLEVVSAVNISTTASNLFFCSFFAMGTTVSIIVGQLLGAGELERAVDEDRKLIFFAVVLNIAVGLLMILVAPLIPKIYNTTEIVKQLASHLLVVSAVMMPVNAFTNACYFTLRSGGKTLITFLFDSAFLWIFSVPCALVLSRFTGIAILPMYAIIQALDIIKCVFGYCLVKGRHWVNNLVVN